MARCEVCGNHYDKSFRISLGIEVYDFDSFECAIAKLAPHCDHCHYQIIGHGVKEGEKVFCCEDCAANKIV